MVFAIRIVYLCNLSLIGNVVLNYYYNAVTYISGCVAVEIENCA